MQPLSLQEHERVFLTVERASNWVQATGGILGWKGSSEELQHYALHPDFDPEESP